MPTHAITQTYSGAGASVTGSVTVTDDEEQNIELVLATSSTNIEIDIAITRLNVKMFCLFCTAACTVKTNNSGSPTETITLVAGVPIMCSNLAAYEAIISADVTKLFLTCAAGGTFELRCLKHSTNP